MFTPNLPCAEAVALAPASVISAAVANQDYAPFETMLRVLMNPYEEQSGSENYAALPPESETGYRTFCGT